MVFNAAFNNILVISRLSILLVVVVHLTTMRSRPRRPLINIWLQN